MYGSVWAYSSLSRLTEQGFSRFAWLCGRSRARGKLGTSLSVGRVVGADYIIIVTRKTSLYARVIPTDPERKKYDGL